VAPLSFTGRILQWIVWFCCVRPKVTVIVALATAAISTGYSAHYLTFETSKFHLLPLGQRYATLYKDYAEDFGQLEDIVVVVESPAVETSTAYAVRLASALRDRIPGTARVSYRIDASRLEAHALLYLPYDTLERTLVTVASHEDLLADFAAAPTVNKILGGLLEGDYVTRERYEDDGRSTRIFLTDKGENAKALVEEKWTEIEEQTVLGMSSTEALIFKPARRSQRPLRRKWRRR